MKHSLFIADLHLCASRPSINEIFFTFLRGPALDAEGLYILGDLFEYWPGDDGAGMAFYAEVIAALRQVSAAGVRLFLMHGNRDFLIGAKLASELRAELLPDPYACTLYGTPSLLMHGDTLCTDDLAYQEFRDQVRDPEWQHAFLATPLEERIATAESLRRQSAEHKQNKAMSIMDVNPDAVAAVFRDYACTRLIHGHTHRPAFHQLEVTGQTCERWVLNDWYEKGGYLRCSEQGCAQVWL